MEVAGPFTLTVDAYPATDASLDTSIVGGRIAGIGVKYDTAGSVDLAISTKGNIGPAVDILTVSSANTDGWFYPVPSLVHANDSAITDQYGFAFPVYDNLTLALTGGAGGDSVEIVFLLE